MPSLGPLASTQIIILGRCVASHNHFCKFYVLLMMIIGIDLGESSIRVISGHHDNNFKHHPPTILHKSDRVGHY
jgi:hypothetical protein